MARFAIVAIVLLGCSAAALAYATPKPQPYDPAYAPANAYGSAPTKYAPAYGYEQKKENGLKMKLDEMKNAIKGAFADMKDKMEEDKYEADKKKAEKEHEKECLKQEKEVSKAHEKIMKAKAECEHAKDKAANKCAKDAKMYAKIAAGKAAKDSKDSKSSYGSAPASSAYGAAPAASKDSYGAAPAYVPAFKCDIEANKKVQNAHAKEAKATAEYKACLKNFVAMCAPKKSSYYAAPVAKPTPVAAKPTPAGH